MASRLVQPNKGSAALSLATKMLIQLLMASINSGNWPQLCG